MAGNEDNILRTKMRIRIGVVSLKSMTLKQEEIIQSCNVLTEIIGCAWQLGGKTTEILNKEWNPSTKAGSSKYVL